MEGRKQDRNRAEGGTGNRPDGKNGESDAAIGRTQEQLPGAGQAASPAGETLDRDAMGQADYGGTRESAGKAAAARQQGGVSSDDAAGGGREPSVDRDRDYDPDGERTNSTLAD